MKLDDAKALIIEINRTVSKLEPAVRSRAFEILAEIAFDGWPNKSGDGAPPKAKTARKITKSRPSDESADFEDFINRFEHDKPSDNLKLLIAWLYSRHGKYAISLKSLKEMAAETGLVIPEKPDMTLRVAREKKKPLFRKAKRGHFQLTTAGETFIKGKYEVKKGTNPPPSEDDE